MLIPICPSCGALLANIQIPYELDMEALYAKYGKDEKIDHEIISSNDIDKFSDFLLEKEKIVKKYTKRNCCRIRLINYIDLASVIN